MQEVQNHENAILAGAMNALQERVKELESCNGAFRREISLLRLRLNESFFQSAESEENNLADAENMVQMLSSTTETLHELRQIKKENRLLQEEAAQIETELGTILKENTVLSVKNKKMEKQISDFRELQSEYEAFILQILSPQPVKKNVKLDVTFLKTIGTKTTYSIPAKIQTQLSKLRSLPIDFANQRIETKKEIIQALMDTKSIIDDLNYEIYEIQSTAKADVSLKRDEKRIQKKLNYIAVLTQETNRFKIH